MKLSNWQSVLSVIDATLHPSFPVIRFRTFCLFSYPGHLVNFSSSLLFTIFSLGSFVLWEGTSLQLVELVNIWLGGVKRCQLFWLFRKLALRTTLLQVTSSTSSHFGTQQYTYYITLKIFSVHTSCNNHDNQQVLSFWQWPYMPPFGGISWRWWSQGKHAIRPRPGNSLYVDLCVSLVCD